MKPSAKDTPQPPHIPNPRFKRGRGRPYVPDVMQRIRVLAEGTALSQAAIAAKAGVAQATVWRLCQKHGWRRTADTERWKPLVAVDRLGLAAPLAAGYGRLAVLTGQERERARPPGVAHAIRSAA